MVVGPFYTFSRLKRLSINVSTGESHSALILLYRAIDLPTAEEVKD